MTPLVQLPVALSQPHTNTREAFSGCLDKTNLWVDTARLWRCSIWLGFTFHLPSVDAFGHDVGSSSTAS